MIDGNGGEVEMRNRAGLGAGSGGGARGRVQCTAGEHERCVQKGRDVKGGKLNRSLTTHFDHETRVGATSNCGHGGGVMVPVLVRVVDGLKEAAWLKALWWKGCWVC